MVHITLEEITGLLTEYLTLRLKPSDQLTPRAKHSFETRALVPELWEWMNEHFATLEAYEDRRALVFQVLYDAERISNHWHTQRVLARYVAQAFKARI
jgi:hypothetical protein